MRQGDAESVRACFFARGAFALGLPNRFRAQRWYFFGGTVPPRANGQLGLVSPCNAGGFASDLKTAA